MNVQKRFYSRNGIPKVERLRVNENGVIVCSSGALDPYKINLRIGDYINQTLPQDILVLTEDEYNTLVLELAETEEYILTGDTDTDSDSKAIKLTVDLER